MGSVDILAGCLHFHFHHAFLILFDLWAHYIYTPLHGPYSLSEALEGLIFYPLNESQDLILIGSQRFLRHELVLELSNVVDDLQDYLLYFSPTFLISPPTFFFTRSHQGAVSKLQWIKVHQYLLGGNHFMPGHRMQNC